MTGNIKVDENAINQVVQANRTACQATDQELGHKQREMAQLLQQGMQQLAHAQAVLGQAQAAVQRWEQELRRAEAALRACMSADRDGRRSNCSAEQAAVQHAQAMLARARDCLQQAQVAFQQVQQQVGQIRSNYDMFNQAASNYRANLNNLLNQSDREAQRLKTALAQYQAGQLGMSGGGSSTASSTNGVNSSDFHGNTDTRLLTSNQLQSSRDDINGPQDFGSRLPYDKAQHHVRQWYNDVRPLVEQGYTEEQIYQEDLRRGLRAPDSLSNTYSMMYGSDAIAAEYNPATGRYNLLNGNHRLFVAREMGIPFLPVRII